MAIDSILAVFKLADTVLDKIFPDPEQKAKARRELLELQQSGRLEELKTQMSAIIAEAQSTDKWTSRARPSFLYVVYILLLWSLPMGLASIFFPEQAASFTVGFKAWLNAIPEPILNLFGIVMLGYVGGRSWEKVKGKAK